MPTSDQPNPPEYLLGELLVQFGLVSQESCREVLRKATIERQLTGQIFLSSGLIKQQQLESAIQCQSLVREGLVTIEQASAAIDITQTGKTLEQGFEQLGLSPNKTERRSLIGELLLKSGCISASNLKFALAQQQKKLLPIGQTLVSVGLLSDELLTAAVNAQGFIRAGRLDKSVAIEALRQLKQKRRNSSDATPKRERSFYQYPQERKVANLEDLLLHSGIISKSELSIAHRDHLLKAENVTTILLETNLLDSETLDVALELLKLVKCESLNMEEASDALVQVTEGHPLAEALYKIRNGRKRESEPCLIDLLRVFGCVNNAQLAIAFDSAQYDSKILRWVLLNSGMQDEETLRRVEECHSLIQQQGISLADARKVFDLSNTNLITITEALRLFAEVKVDGTDSDDSVQADAAEVSQQQETNFDRPKWQKSWRSAMALIEQNDLTGGRLLLESLKEAASSRRVVDYIACLDAIAETYVQEQNHLLAERYYSFALDSRLQHFEIDSIECASGMNALGKVYYFQKRYEEAEKYVKEFIRISSKRLGPTHASVACGWQNIATIYQAQGKFYYAEHAYKLAIKGCVEAMGENHPTAIKAKSAYANLLVHIRRLKEAELLHSSANGDYSGSWRTIDVDDLANGGSLAADSA